MSRGETEDGIEQTFALNHLSYFLLTQLLLDPLKAAAPSRIVNVSSHAHKSAKLDLDDVEGKRSYSGWTAYCNSKLENILFTYELARRLEGTRVTVNALHPGFVASGFGHNNGVLARVGMRIAQLFAISEDKGAETSVYLASSPEVEGVSGRYFYKKREVRSTRISYDTSAQSRLWQMSEQMTGKA
jgi:NAD(P)-dependent dehydrogenase (short-subunit alcohol dehydrogenase family)